MRDRERGGQLNSILAKQERSDRIARTRQDKSYQLEKEEDPNENHGKEKEEREFEIAKDKMEAMRAREKERTSVSCRNAIQRVNERRTKGAAPHIHW